MSAEWKEQCPAVTGGEHVRAAPLCYSRSIPSPREDELEPAGATLQVFLVLLSIGSACAAFMTVGASWTLH